MDLSNDLVSQFAKITTGDKDKNNETTVYGTVKVYDGITCVKIDGSDLLTPVDTTTEVKEGERVTVLIKNHSAVITGNTSDPSAGLSTTDGISENLTKVVADIGVFKNLTAENFKTTNAEIENLTAKDAQIENLVTTKASIEELEAVQAKIKDLDVEYVNAELAEINEAIIKKADIELLNAETAAINEALIKKADIADLNALDAEINNLSSNFATIQQLDAANANINTLDAEVADIQTLVNGNLTSDNISSLNLTSANTTVENAFIKDAMIDSVTASKLTAGIIDTSAITIKSTDGSMLITGSVQQFKDENGKVRIQIGKDSGGNFTFILYDESGTGVLIDESGIKSSEAIADGLIVDSKVAENANISGSKLDIASVITEVNNDNSTTIKSNKIYLNEQGQSLEVAFNSLKTQVETIQDVTIDGDLTNIIEQVQSNTTQINVNKSEISTLVSQNEIRKEEIKNLDDEIVEVSTDINSKYTSLQQDLSGFKTTVGESYATKQSVTDVSNNLTNNYSTTSAMNTAINQKANEITSSVSETYTTKSEFNNLNVGGTNLLPNSKTLLGWVSKGLLQDGHYDGTFTGAFMSFTDTSGYKEVLCKNSFLKLEPNTQYTLSFWARGIGRFYSYLYKSGTTVVSNGYNSSGSTTTSSDGAIISTLTNNDVLTRYWITWTTSNSITKDTLLNLIVARAAAEIGNCSIVICGIKLEKGNKATDWSPSPEDIQGEIDAVSNDLTVNYSTTSQMNSAINQKANEITSSVSQTYATKQSVTDVSNNLTNNYSTTSAMNTAINQKANEITSSVSQTYATKQSVTDVSNNLTNNYSTTSAMNTAINQKANEITNSVSQTYTTKSEFNNLSVGGRNLLAVPNETTVYSSTGVSGSAIDTLAMGMTITPTGTEYIVSFEAKASANMTCKCYFYNPNTTTSCEALTGYKGTNVDGQCYVNITTSWTRYWVKWTQTVPTSKKYVIVGRNETAGVTLEIRAVKFEEGNKPTAWSPAPELATNSINSLTTRMQTAESKLTKESLTTTIGDYYTTESKINSYGYATTSQVTQTKNDLTATFKSIGGYNLIKNSCGYGGTRGWRGNTTISSVCPASHARSVGFDAILYLTNTDTSERYAFSQRFEMKPNTTYTLSGYIWKNPNVSGYDVFVLTSKDVPESDTGTSYTNAITAHTGSAQSPTYFEKTFTTVSDTISGVVRVDHNGYNNSGNTINCNVHFTGLCLVEGSVAKPWSPHPSETYSASTIMDAQGIKVTHTNAVGYTQMDANGFYLNDGTKNVLSITSSGAIFNMPISASLITTGTLSGNRISGGTISAADEISFVGGARIFGTGGEHGATLSISASEYYLSGASQSFLGGNWTVDDKLTVNGTSILTGAVTTGGNLTVAGTAKSKTLNVTSTSTLSGGVTCGSTLSANGITSTSTLNVSGTSTLTGAVTMGSSLSIGNVLNLQQYSVYLGTIWQTVNAPAIKFGTDSYVVGHSGIHIIDTSGNAQTLRAGTIYSNGTTVTSDRRKKMDIRYVNIDKQSIGESGRMAPNTNITIQDMHEFIGSLPLTSFRYKDEVKGNRNLTHYGFLTQDIMYSKVGSELVAMLDEDKRIGDEEDYTGYSVEKLLMFVCGALQEEIHQRQLLEKEIKNLKEGK